MNEKNQFTEGRIVPKLIGFAVPVLFAMLLQSLYSAVDLLVVGQFSDTADVSAVAVGGQMMHMIMVLINGLASGTTIILGQAIGGNQKERCGNIIGTCILFFAILAGILTVVMQFLAVPFANLLDAPAEAFDKTIDYVRICTGGTLFIAAYNLLGSLFRGLGDSKTPLIAVAIASVINIIGDLFFVAVLHMAAAGAALATVIAQAISVILCLAIIKRKGLPFPFTKKSIRLNSKIIKHILEVGFPIALQDALVTVSFLFLNGIVNGLGVIASAGVGVAGKICNFVMLAPSAFAQSLSSFVAQNIGAGKMKRARQSMGYGMIASFVICLVMAYISFFHGEFLGAIFSKDPEVIVAAADYLKAYAVDTFVVCFLFCFIGYFNGCGKTTFVMIQGLIGALAIRVPVAYIMVNLPQSTLFMIGLSTPASTVVQLAICIVYFAILLKKERRGEQIVSVH